MQTIKHLRPETQGPGKEGGRAGLLLCGRAQAQPATLGRFLASRSLLRCAAAMALVVDSFEHGLIEVAVAEAQREPRVVPQLPEDA